MNGVVAVWGRGVVLAATIAAYLAEVRPSHFVQGKVANLRRGCHQVLLAATDVIPTRLVPGRLLNLLCALQPASREASGGEYPWARRRETSCACRLPIGGLESTL
jgi:hypothetical protein